MSDKKTILIIHHHGSIGGAGLSLLHIVQSIDRKRYDVVVVCPQDPSDMVKALEKIDRVRIIKTSNSPIIFPHYNGGIKYAFSLRSIFNLIAIKSDKKNILRIIDDIKPNYLLVNSMLLSFVGKYVRKQNFVKICFCRETYQKGLFGFRTHLIKHWMSDYFDKVVFISKHDSDATIPCRAKKYLITDKVDMSCYDFNNVSNNTNGVNNLLYLGGTAKIKGIHILLKSINYVKSKNITYNIVADESIKQKPHIIDYLLSFFKLSSSSLARVAYFKVKNKEKIIFLPPSPKPESYYNFSNVVVFPSTVAHQSRPIYEAGAAKIPIIISDFPETKEFAKDQYNCVTFEPGDFVDLATQIDRIIFDKKLRDYVTKNNYMMTLNNHDLRVMPKEMQLLLDD